MNAENFNVARLGFAVAFARANENSPYKNSFLPLVNEVMKYVNMSDQPIPIAPILQVDNKQAPVRPIARLTVATPTPVGYGPVAASLMRSAESGSPALRVATASTALNSGANGQQTTSDADVKEMPAATFVDKAIMREAGLARFVSTSINPSNGGGQNK